MKQGIFISGCLSLLLAAIPCLGDTGTYRIEDYQVKLTPKSDGTVEIRYVQKWLVNGGHIPWITVGTPNSSFEILEAANTGNIRKIRSDSSGSWSGVKIDLDRDYGPGQVFQVGFTIVQHDLFYEKDDRYAMEFVPGWYDRARINHLKVEVFLYAKIETVKASPPPSHTEGQSMIWSQSDLQPGQRFSLSISFPKSFLPQGIPAPKFTFNSSWFAWSIFLVIFSIILLSILRSILQGIHRGYGGGRIFYGGAGGSSGKSGSSFWGGIFSGGGGGFGGRGSSCACACAGCACACACAGGGAAGCDRKLTYRCPLCTDCPHSEKCPLWVRGKT